MKANFVKFSYFWGKWELDGADDHHIDFVLLLHFLRIVSRGLEFLRAFGGSMGWLMLYGWPPQRKNSGRRRLAGEHSSAKEYSKSSVDVEK